MDHLTGCFGDGGHEHAPANRSRRQLPAPGPAPPAGSPHWTLEKYGRAEDQDEHLGYAGQEDPDHLAAQHLDCRGRGNQQARQGALVAFGQERTPAIADGVHQEHQRHAGSQQGQHIEFDSFAAGCDIIQRDGGALVGGFCLAGPYCFANRLGLLDLDATAGNQAA